MVKRRVKFTFPTDQITDPVMVPASKLIPRIGMIDISPMIIVFTLFIVAEALGAPRIF